MAVAPAIGGGAVGLSGQVLHVRPVTADLPGHGPGRSIQLGGNGTKADPPGVQDSDPVSLPSIQVLVWLEHSIHMLAPYRVLHLLIELAILKPPVS